MAKMCFQQVLVHQVRPRSVRKRRYGWEGKLPFKVNVDANGSTMPERTAQVETRNASAEVNKKGTYVGYATHLSRVTHVSEVQLGDIIENIHHASSNSGRLTHNMSTSKRFPRKVTQR
mmetsp:Transcript_18270/g.40819  ORF Transcript_18270/g.40819 Transcript_18270/m.40819 type:complete len:118 (-) Transcript_18270:5-358(-)